MSPPRNINYISKALRFPCAVNGPFVIIKTGLEAAIPVLFSLNQFSCLDILKSRAGISWKCGRQLKGIIEKAHGPKIVNAGHFLYHLGPALGEKALWWWFVAELGTGFVADWTSLMYQESGCESPSSTHFSVACQTLFLDPGGPYSVFIDPSGPGACAESKANEIIVPSGCTATIMYEIKWHPHNDHPGDVAKVESWLEDQDGTRYMPMESTWNSKEPGSNAFSAVVHLESRFGTAHHYHIRWRVIDGTSVGGFGHVHVTTTGRNVQPFPVSCKLKPVTVPDWFGSPVSPAF